MDLCTRTPHKGHALGFRHSMLPQLLVSSLQFMLTFKACTKSWALISVKRLTFVSIKIGMGKFCEGFQLKTHPDLTVDALRSLVKDMLPNGSCRAATS